MAEKMPCAPRCGCSSHPQTAAGGAAALIIFLLPLLQCGFFNTTLWTWWFLQFKNPFLMQKIKINQKQFHTTSEWAASKEDGHELNAGDSLRSFNVPTSGRMCVISVMFPRLSRLLERSGSLRLHQVCSISYHLHNHRREYSGAADTKTE